MSAQNTFLIFYGFFKLALGVAQLTGLVGGYFLLEWIIRYPPQAFVVQEDLLLITYLAVIFRGIFHIIAGVGMARHSLWTKSFLRWGWPVVALITFGILVTTHQSWSNESWAESLGQAIDWPKAFVYLLMILFDMFWVPYFIDDANGSLKDEESRLENSKIVLFGFLVGLCVLIVLFFGRQLQSGFYKGFYKAGGTKSAPPEPQLVVEPKPVVTIPKESPQTAPIPDTQFEDAPEETSSIDGIFKVNKEALKETPVLTSGKEPNQMVDYEVGELESGLSSKKALGFLAGACVILGLLAQVLMGLSGVSRNAFLSSYFFFAIGFGLWIVYGMNLELLPVSLSSAAGFILSVVLILLKLRQDNL